MTSIIRNPSHELLDRLPMSRPFDGFRIRCRAMSITLTIRDRFRMMQRDYKTINGGLCWQCCPLVRFSWEVKYE